jgi:hypothetical protein
VRVFARDRGVGLVLAFQEDHIVAAKDALLGVGNLRHPPEVDARLIQQVFGTVGLALHDRQAATGSRRRSLGTRVIVNCKRPVAGFPGVYGHREPTRNLATRASQHVANVVLQPFVRAKRRFVQCPPVRVGGSQSHRQIRVRKYPLPPRHRLDFGRDLFQDGAMDHQQLVGIGGAEHLLGPMPETPFDALLDFGKQAHF